VAPSATQRAAVDVFRYLDYRAFLSAWYETKRDRMSYRAFSKRAGLGAPNYLQLVIAGQRNLTRATAEKFADACSLADDRKAYFLVLVEFNQATTDAQRNRYYAELSAFRRYRRAHKLELAEAQYHSQWYLPAVRELVHCPDFVEDAEWIAKRLLPPITAKQAQDALDALLRLGLLERDTSGKLRQRERVVSTGPETAGLHIRNYHAEMMARATRAMELVPREFRDVSSLTLTLKTAALPEIKQRIAEFRRELADLCDSEDSPDVVLQLNLQLFPLSSPMQEHPAGATKKGSKP
jgi:uncharacterized protein (TIGR02147 family)